MSFGFDGGSFDPVTRILRNNTLQQDVNLPPKPAQIFQKLLEQSPNFLERSVFRQELWSETKGDKSFNDCFKSHLSKLKRTLESLGLSGVLEKKGNTFGITVKVNKTPDENETHRRESRNEVGVPPPGATDVFRNRVKEIEKLKSLLSYLRAVNIHGRFGVGKTALAYKVITSLLQERKVEGVAYLSPHTGLGLGLDQIFRRCSELLGEQAKHVQDIWGNTKIPTKHKIQVLVEQFSDRRYIILLDGLEELMKEGYLLDPDLSCFLETFIVAPHRGRLLITSSEPLHTAGLDSAPLIYHYALDEGLPRDEGIEFFKSLYADGAGRLRKIPVRYLVAIHEKTRGFPRALTYVARILATKPTLKLKELLENEKLFLAEVIDPLGRAAHAGLSEEELRVMQALSIFNQPVTHDAVAFLLKPYLDADAVDKRLNRLEVGKYVNITDDDHGVTKFTAQPWDSALSYDKIPNDDSEYSKKALHLRAADYYVLMQPSLKNWKTIASFEPFLAEFDQRIKGQDYEKAFNLIDSIDAGYLSAWGYYHYVIRMREALLPDLDMDQGVVREKFSDIREAINLRCLSSAYLNSGKYDPAHSFARQARERALKLGDKSEEAIALTYAGSALYNLGRYQLAEANFQEALILLDAAKNKYVEGNILSRLGALYGNLAQHKKALQYEREALSIAKLTNNQGAKCSALSWMGTLWMEMGAFDKALRCHREALATARDSNLRKSEGICLAQMGATLRESGSYQRAMDSFELSLSIAHELGDAVTEMKALGGMGKIHLLQLRNEEALKNFLRALAIASELNMEGPQQHWGTCVAQVYLHKDQLIDALKNITKPPSEYLSWNNHRVALLKGIILARWFRDEPHDGTANARVAFEEAQEFADQLLITTPEYYGAAYTRCLASFGLALISSGTERTNFLRQARASLKKAVAICAKPGVLNDYSRLLSELAPLDTGNVLAAASQALDTGKTL